MIDAPTRRRPLRHVYPTRAALLALLLSLMPGLAAVPGHAAAPGDTAGSAHAAPWGADARAPTPELGDLLGCGMWLDFLGRCVDALGAAPSEVPPEFPAEYRRAAPDRAGIRRDTYYFLGLQLSIIGTLYLMPESMSGWSDEQKNQHHADKWWRNVTHPDWDDDDDYINYVLHPYWGAAYYVRARERGYGAAGGFWYSFLLSTMYEAGVEALFEPLSIQDFFVTPIVGSLLGHQFMNWREATRERMTETRETRFRDQLLLVATDPLGNAADFVDRRFGRKVEFRAVPFASTMSSHPWGAHDWNQALHAPEAEDRVYGLRLNVRW